MNTRLPLEERSISQIFLEYTNTKYVIPIYQRNYAWGDVQIKALIEDVYDSWKKDSDRPYYIGTLVTYDRGNDVFEVIDGQQRLTTTYIILKVLIHEFNIKRQITSQLTYSARQLAANTLLSLGQKNHDKSVEEIATGYKIAKGAIVQKTFPKPDGFNNFVNYLLHNVHIIHYKVPKDVDLNHYFEVMNSRGEQLESHEIVKSRFNNVLDDNERSVFNRVWEACSEMNLYIQQTFADKTIFGNHLDSFKIAEFAEIPTLKDNEDSGKKSIQDLLLLQPTTAVEQIEEERNDKFQSIIDFPNFLLIVLKLTCIQEGINVKVILDDKELLEHFDKVLTNKNDKEKKAIAKKFAYNLLKAKYLLDNFIVHHTADDDKELKNPWKLQYYYKENDKNKYTLSLAKDDKTQTELQHILSMLEVTFTPKQRKNYLLYCLLYLFDSNNMPLDISLKKTSDAQSKKADYLKFLQNLTEKYFYDVYLWGELNSSNQPQPDAFDSAILEGGKLNWIRTTRDGNPKDKFNTIYEQGSANIPLYVFNYMDYILWKKYADNLKGKKLKKGDNDLDKFFKELGCSYFDLNFFFMFYFTRTRKSLEHFYPQANAVDEENNPDRLSHKEINCFGNFAMIGAEANSSGSNWSPRAKLDHYFPDTNSDTTPPSKINNVSVASIKFKIMAQMCNDNIKNKHKGQEWMRGEIKAHQDAMLNILFPTN